MEDITRLLFHDSFHKRQGWHKLFEDPLWMPIFDAPLK